MVLPNATLFPQAFLPLHIFEPRYRRMLDDALDTHRMFAIARPKPGRRRDIPCAVAGLGLVRASVTAPDGTSNLILEGLARVELTRAVRTRPYRVHRLRPLSSTVHNEQAADALAARLLELVAKHLTQPAHRGESVSIQQAGPQDLQKETSFITRLDSPAQVADLVSWTLLTDSDERQTLLETLNVESRLRRLIQFLLAASAGPKSN